ncbi:hypothetical protein D3C73_1572100 [compost metagenome]
MTDEENTFKAGGVSRHEMNHGSWILEKNTIRMLQIHRTLHGLIGELQHAEAPFFTQKGICIINRDVMVGGLFLV